MQKGKISVSHASPLGIQPLTRRQTVISVAKDCQIFKNPHTGDAGSRERWRRGTAMGRWKKRWRGIQRGSELQNPEPWASIVLAYTPLWGPQDVPCSSGSTGGPSAFPALQLWWVASWPASRGRYWQVDLGREREARLVELSFVFWMQTIVWGTPEGSGIIQKLRSLAALTSGILKLILSQGAAVGLWLLSVGNLLTPLGNCVWSGSSVAFRNNFQMGNPTQLWRTLGTFSDSAKLVFPFWFQLKPLQYLSLFLSIFVSLYWPSPSFNPLFW